MLMTKVSTYIILIITEAKLKVGEQMWKKLTLSPSGFSVVYLKVNTVNHTLLCVRNTAHSSQDFQFDFINHVKSSISYNGSLMGFLADWNAHIVLLQMSPFDHCVTESKFWKTLPHILL